MAFPLHMETEQVYACVSRLRTESEAISLEARALISAARSVEWHGPSRDIFQRELEQIAIAMDHLADECDTLATRAKREADEWQQTDSYFVRQFSQIIIRNTV